MQKVSLVASGRFSILALILHHQLSFRHWVFCPLHCTFQSFPNPFWTWQTQLSFSTLSSSRSVPYTCSWLNSANILLSPSWYQVFVAQQVVPTECWKKVPNGSMPPAAWYSAWVWSLFSHVCTHCCVLRVQCNQSLFQCRMQWQRLPQREKRIHTFATSHHNIDDLIWRSLIEVSVFFTCLTCTLFNFRTCSHCGNFHVLLVSVLRHRWCKVQQVQGGSLKMCNYTC